MECELSILKKVFFLCLGLAVPAATHAQGMTASAAITAKTPLPTIAEGIVHSNQTTLLSLVTKAGLMPILSNAGSYTFFAPSEESVAQLNGKTPDELKATLSQHIVQGVITKKDMRDGADLKTISGHKLRICRKKEDILIDGVKITSADQPFSNGVWHQLKGAFKAPVSNAF